MTQSPYQVNVIQQLSVYPAPFQCIGENHHESVDSISVFEFLKNHEKMQKSSRGFKKRFFLRQRVSAESVYRLAAFRSTIEVMLLDGVLTREEKRLIIRLSSILNLEPHQPAEIYQAILNNEKTEDGDELTTKEQHEIYKTVFEVAIINASLSKDEFRVMAHLRDIFSIDDQEHDLVERELKDMVKQRFEDPNMVEKTLTTLRDSVRVVTTLFDNVRKKNNGETQ